MIKHTWHQAHTLNYKSSTRLIVCGQYGPRISFSSWEMKSRWRATHKEEKWGAGGGVSDKADIRVKCLSSITFPFEIRLYEYAPPHTFRGFECTCVSLRTVTQTKSTWIKSEEFRKILLVILNVCVSVCSTECMQEMREREKPFSMEVVAHWQAALPRSASSLLSFLTSFDIFNYVFHTWLGTCFFFFHTLLIVILHFSLSLFCSHLPSLFLHLAHSISFLSGCSLFALCATAVHVPGVR